MFCTGVSAGVWTLGNCEQNGRFRKIADLSPNCPQGQMTDKHFKTFHVHLISDSTGETVGMVARACLVQFDTIDAHEHLWSMVRSKEQVQEVLDGIR